MILSECEDIKNRNAFAVKSMKIKNKRSRSINIKKNKQTNKNNEKKENIEKT